MLALSAGLHGAVWFIVSGQVARAAPAFAAEAAMSGWTISMGPVRRAGWPWAAAAEVSDVVVTRRVAEVPVRWSAERVTLAISPREPRVLRAEPGGVQRVQAGGAPPFAVLAEQATLRVPLTDDGQAMLRLSSVSASTDAGEGVRIAGLEMRFGAGAIVGTATGIMLMPPLPSPFDGAATASLRMVSDTPFPVTPNDAEAAAEWRKAGGMVAVREIELALGPLRVSGTGSGGLDADLQPRFAARIEAQGATDVLDAALRAGLVQPGPARAARAVLGLLTMAVRGGPVILPVTLENRVLTVAQFPLARVPSIGWGPP